MATLLSEIDTSIERHAIKDSFRLGKFNPGNKRPRPLLVKFLRSADATNILSNKSKLKSPVYIKPDLTPEEKAKEQLLLKERRSLIEKGVNRKQIKLRGYNIYIDSKLHCKIVDYKLQVFSESPVATPNTESESPTSMLTDDQSG